MIIWTNQYAGYTSGSSGGDEGKGKEVDEAVDEAKARDDGKRILVARFQGGPNAGHSIYVPDGNDLVKFVTHAAPSGLAHNVDIAVGPHFAFDPEKFLNELDEAKEKFGYDGRIMISEQVGILLPHHRILDAWRENSGKSDIGTTKSGMGPFYESNTNRKRRINFADYISDSFPGKLRGVMENNPELSQIEGFSIDDLTEKILADHKEAREELAPFKERMAYRMKDYMNNGDHVIVEGAQGSMLDVDWGENPYVTSSHLLAGDAISRLGLTRDFKVYGVEKVYPTRVGGGTLPTLTDDKFSKEVSRNAGEEGATTGRPRRAGYPDWALIKKTANLLNDCDGIFLTRVDCVQGRELKVGKGYIVEGRKTEELPGNLEVIEGVKYGENTYRWRLWDGHEDLSVPGKVHTSLKRKREDYVRGGFSSLPSGLRKYVRDHDEFVGVPTVGISLGPARGETVEIDYREFV